MTARAGDWVQVRSKEEILSSLDTQGRFEGLPFMPEMFQYCGQRFSVYKRAHKTCDTVSGNWAGRRLANTVHLALRCDGQAHGGCQAACLIFWKEAWLKPVEQLSSSAESSSLSTFPQHDEFIAESCCTEADVCNATRARDQQPNGATRYVCQATKLLDFTTPLPWWDARQYLEDYRSGNTTLGRIFRGFLYMTYYFGSLAYRGRLGRPARWLYDRVQALYGGIPFPRTKGTIPAGELTPISTLNLQPGELVRTKSFKEILATLDTEYQNRGLGFDAELVPYCGHTYRVRTQVKNFIDEKTGKMRIMKTPAVILEGVFCQSRYSSCRMFCPRSIYSWWREIWLERIPESSAAPRLDKSKN